MRDGYANMEQAWEDGGEVAVTRQAVRKYAQVIDVTESGRDMKPLITGMFEAIDRLRQLEAGGGIEGTPVAEVIRLSANG